MLLQPISFNFNHLLDYANSLWEFNYNKTFDNKLVLFFGNDVFEVDTSEVNKFGRYTFLHTNAMHDIYRRKIIEHRDLEFGIFLLIAYYSNREWSLPIPSIEDWKRFRLDVIRYNNLI